MIGGPTDFEHKQSLKADQLSPSGTGVRSLFAPNSPVPGGAGGTDLNTGGEMIHVVFGHQDTEGTVVTDDEDSDWEDEATRIFRNWD